MKVSFVKAVFRVDIMDLALRLGVNVVYQSLVIIL